MRLKPNSILEVGGIDRPLLAKSNDYEYIGIDIDEQPACHEIYDEFIVRSIEESVERKVDLIISCTLLEHVANNENAIKVMHEALNDHGVMHHYVPSKWHPYAIALRLVGPTIQKILIPLLRPGAEAVSGYPAFFNHCSPQAMRRLVNRTGFSEVSIKPFYRASDYFAFFVPAYLLVVLFENACARFGWSFFCSGFVISAKR